MRRAVGAALMNGLMSGGWSCCQGEVSFLSVRMRDIGLGMRRRDLDPSFPAVNIVSHHSLWLLMCDWKSPLRYLMKVVREMRPTDAVVLLRNGRLPLRARWRQKSMMPEAVSCKRPWMESSLCLQDVFGGLLWNAVSHSSGRVIPSSVVMREKRRSACAVVKE